MITLLPYADYDASARVLDRRTLSEQRRINHDVMTALLRGTGRVSNPTVLMWRRYEWALMRYQRAICTEWIERGFVDTYLDKTQDLYDRYSRWVEQMIWPYWSSSERLHMSHQSELLRRDYVYYRPQFPSAPFEMEVVYPEPIDDYKKFDPAPWWEPKESF